MTGQTLWIESEHTRGGVAILLNLYSSIKELDPWHEHYWIPHWVAVRITFLGDLVRVDKVCAQSDKTAREDLFDRVLHHLLGYVGLLVLKGDFNCTLVPRLDRSLKSLPRIHDALALRRLLLRAHLNDVLKDAMGIAGDDRDIPPFQAAALTYSYTLPDGESANLRVDRWYVSSRHADSIRDVAFPVPGTVDCHNKF